MRIDKHTQREQEKIIDIIGVSFAYGSEKVIEDITFTVNRGDYIGLIGPNGGGKTTLLKVILGLLMPQQGKVLVAGQDIHSSRKERAHIGYVPQRSSQIDLNFPATVEEVVESGLTAQLGVWQSFSASDKSAIEKSLDIVDMAKHRKKLINSLSGGQRQRAFIARALAGEPQILILDEPTVGVDQASQKHFFEFLELLNKKHNLTIILVSHDIDTIKKNVSHVLSINHKIVSYATNI